MHLLLQIDLLKHYDFLSDSSELRPSRTVAEVEATVEDSKRPAEGQKERSTISSDVKAAHLRQI